MKKIKELVGYEGVFKVKVKDMIFRDVISISTVGDNGIEIVWLKDGMKNSFVFDADCDVEIL